MLRAGNLLLVCSTAASFAALAQGYPDKPIRLVVGFTAGGGPDIVARLLAPKLSDSLGQPVVVDNRPGAGGSIAEDLVAKAAPDGYTVLACSNSIAINPGLYKNLPYNAGRDLAPITLTGISAQVLIVARAFPANSVEELVALGKAKPNTLTFGSSGNGSGSHLAGELFKNMTHVQMTHVPYKGGGQGVVAVLSGDVSMMFAPSAAALPLVRSGKLKALAVTTATRSAAAPEVPTVSEAGVRGYEAFPWYGLLVPAGTPKTAIDKLLAHAVKAMELPDIKDRYANLGIQAAPTTPQEFAVYIRTETRKWDKVIKEGSVKAE
jgi:tripartite-type tricarboxylate transporter receptor subunit TctC